MDGIGRRRTDRWVFQPGPGWRCMVSAGGLGATAACVTAAMFFTDGAATASLVVVGCVAGTGAVAVVVTHQIVARFHASADAYFLGFQAGFEAASSGVVDAEVVRRRMQLHTEARLRRIDGRDLS